MWTPRWNCRANGLFVFASANRLVLILDLDSSVSETYGSQEGKKAVKRTRISRHDFVDNQVRLQLFALAYNVRNFLRRPALPRSVKHWSLTAVRAQLIKIGPKSWVQGLGRRLSSMRDKSRFRLRRWPFQSGRSTLSSSQQETWPAIAGADLLGTVFAGMEKIQERMGRSA